MKALRWFKTVQRRDGSWGGSHQVAQTGLVLLAYLGHCETPLSEEFGEAVTNGMVYLIENSVKNKGRLCTTRATNTGSTNMESQLTHSLRPTCSAEYSDSTSPT